MTETAPVDAPARVRIREFTPDDYPALVAIHNHIFPDYADTPEQWRFSDERREEKIKWGRFVAETEDGKIIGAASYSQSNDMYHPQKFHLDVHLHPEWEGQGIGKTLYARVLETLAQYDPILIRAHCREDFTRGVRFLTERGFEEEMRDWESRMDPRALDFSQWDGAREKVAAQGITVKSVAELAKTDPDWEHKLYEMDWTITLDMPAPDTFTKPPFEQFKKNVLENPDFMPEGWFVALDGDAYVGESALWRSQTDTKLYVGATGVLREYRRRGIATALKIDAIEYAASIGCPQIKTWNAQSNRPMLSINEALGFEKQPAWIAYAKKLKEDAQ